MMKKMMKSERLFESQGGPIILSQRRGPGATSDRVLDAKTLRRLAQNREAARKSRLQKKAYVQQLESGRIRLSQLEQELQRPRSQGLFLGGGGGNARGNMSSAFKESKIFGGVLWCTGRKWAIGTGPKMHGKGSSLDQWAKHRKILDGICEGQLWCLQVFWNLPSPKMPAWLRSTNSKMVQLQECL
ncbi:hypothetical protein POM88_053239 [Heracleum sosnowskyi]|uniref:BZIP domain-containing protein n=1 Tax=Heracleum sosnowskyi TaxID=360622 RepID=A0AAD8GQG3_9APIA|nr:hypothetical protein POM88_053239 [Heracleum sosnowskyi]